MEIKIDRYKETFKTWDKLATLYQDKFMDLDLYNETYDFLCGLFFKKKLKILEIGCGPGNITQYLLRKRPDLNIFASDISPNMIELAKKNNPLARFEVLDSRRIDQIKTKFDAMVCGFCLPYLSHDDCKKLICDAANILHENGILYVSYVEGDNEKSGFQIISTGDRTYFYFHNLDMMKTNLTTNNFEIIKIFKLTYNKSEKDTEIHTVLIAKKLQSNK
jgi:2-polyprenyl-3-methyl-5-hydroxy-6-metoxy-1,4-benzoquinol methylase